MAREQLGTEGFAQRAVADRITRRLAWCAVGYGRIHGDLRRENIIALPDGGVGIIDFDDRRETPFSQTTEGTHARLRVVRLLWLQPPHRPAELLHPGRHTSRHKPLLPRHA
ncbi:phosphotransferase [Nocardia carnea]|uniref:phosphotransferase n=1 Tax=Nocardia carnea TaxID=37328 RepID=UPI003D7B946A